MNVRRVSVRWLNLPGIPSSLALAKQKQWARTLLSPVSEVFLPLGGSSVDVATAQNHVPEVIGISGPHRLLSSAQAGSVNERLAATTLSSSRLRNRCGASP